MLELLVCSDAFLLGWLAMLVFASRRMPIAAQLHLTRVWLIVWMFLLPFGLGVLAVMGIAQAKFKWWPFLLIGVGGMSSFAAFTWLVIQLSINLSAAAMLQRNDPVDAASGRLLLRKFRTLRSLHRLLLKIQGQSMEKLEQFIAACPETETPRSAYRFRPTPRADRHQENESTKPT